MESINFDKDENAQFDQQLAEMLEPGGNVGKKKRVHKKWNKKRKIIVISAVLLAGVFLVMKVRAGNSVEPIRPVTTITLAKSDIQEKLVISGPVSGTDSVDVVSNLHAEILEMPVKEGMKVEKDQILAVIDRADIEKEIEVARNAYDLAIATLKEQQKEAGTGYAKAKQDYQKAKADFERADVLHRSGDVSQVDWEVAKNTMDDAKRGAASYTVKNGEAEANESYSLQVKNAELELEQKKKLLDDTELKSPIAGTIVRVNTRVGRFADTVEDDKPLFMIENLDVLEMKINVSEYSIGKVKLGQNVTIHADILNGESIEGEVTEISPTGEEKGGGSTERVIPTTIRIKEQNSSLIAGITAKAEIILAESLDTWVVPVSSVLIMEDGKYIAVAENNQVRLLPVEVGVESDIQSEIKPGDGTVLEETMAVIMNPSADFVNGMAVMTMPKK